MELNLKNYNMLTDKCIQKMKELTINSTNHYYAENDAKLGIYIYPSKEPEEVSIRRVEDHYVYMITNTAENGYVVTWDILWGIFAYIINASGVCITKQDIFDYILNLLPKEDNENA